MGPALNAPSMRAMASPPVISLDCVMPYVPDGGRMSCTMEFLGRCNDHGRSDAYLVLEARRVGDGCARGAEPANRCRQPLVQRLGNRCCDLRAEAAHPYRLVRDDEAACLFDAGEHGWL